MRTPLLLLMLAAPAIAIAQPADPPPTDPPPPTEPPKDPPPPTDPALSDRDRCLKKRGELQRHALSVSNLNERTRLLRALPNCETAAGVSLSANVVVPPPSDTTPGTPATPAGPTTAGFAFEARIEAAVTLVDDFALGGTQPGIFLGYHSGKITAGLGFNLSRIAQSTSGPGVETDESATAILLQPGIRAVLATSRDGKTEALGQFDLGYVFISSDDDNTPTSIRVQVAPAIRHWVTPSFAIGASAGLRYDRISQSMELGPGMTVSQVNSTTNLFSSVQMLAIF